MRVGLAFAIKALDCRERGKLPLLCADDNPPCGDRWATPQQPECTSFNESSQEKES